MKRKKIDKMFDELMYMKENGINKALPSKPDEDEPLPVGAHRTPPKGYPKDKWEYADPHNYKYPLDTEKHVRAAISYFSKPENYEKYSKDERKTIWKRILRAAKKYGIEVSEKDKFEKALVDMLNKARENLVKKEIVNKKGKRQVVWVRPGGEKEQIKNRIKKLIGMIIAPYNGKDSEDVREARKKQIKNTIKQLIEMSIAPYKGKGGEVEAAGVLRAQEEGQREATIAKKKKKQAEIAKKKVQNDTERGEQ